MKNFSYLILLFLSMSLVSCGDTNDMLPKVDDPNVEWKLSYVTGFFTGKYDLTTSDAASFNPSLNPTTSRLIIYHNFLDDKRAWFGNSPKDVRVINTANGPEIEITYEQISDDPSTSAMTMAQFRWEIQLAYSQIGKGKYASVPVRVRRTYRDVAKFGFDKVDNYTITLK